MTSGDDDHKTTGSTSTTSSHSTQVAFDRNYKKLQRNNAARAHQIWNDADATNNNVDNIMDSSNHHAVSDHHHRVYYDYFRDEIARRLVDRLDDIKRDEGFPLALDIGTFNVDY